MGGNQLFPRHSKEFKMTDRVAKKILEGARHHCMLKLEELELLQYRLQLATEQISGSGQHISKGSPPQQKQLVSSSTSLASSVRASAVASTTPTAMARPILMESRPARRQALAASGTRSRKRLMCDAGGMPRA